MTADSVLTRELNSLHEEVATTDRKDPSAPSDRASARNGTSAPAAAPESAAGQENDAGAFAELADAIRDFLDRAQGNVSAHPAANMIGALVAGILIGRLLARR